MRFVEIYAEGNCMQNRRADDFYNHTIMRAVIQIAS